MEIKKSYKADLERTRGHRLLLGAVVAAALFVAVLQIPFRERSMGIAESEDTYLIEDLPPLPEKEDDGMITATVSEPEVKTVVRAVDTPVAEVSESVEASVVANDGEAETVKDEEPIHPDANTVALVTDEDPMHFRIVQQVPEFPGGMGEFSKWLTRNLKYPEQSVRSRTQGQVVVSFVVNKDGSTSDLKIVKGSEPRLNAEVLRVMSIMPKWKPGLQNDEPCRTLFVVPVVFKI